MSQNRWITIAFNNQNKTGNPQERRIWLPELLYYVHPIACFQQQKNHKVYKKKKRQGLVNEKG